MQFIFATHNANIPVLGDSEKIIACHYKKNEKIELHSGNIDNPKTQQEIMQIMEGGIETFSKRKIFIIFGKLKNSPVYGSHRIT